MKNVSRLALLIFASQLLAACVPSQHSPVAQSDSVASPVKLMPADSGPSLRQARLQPSSKPQPQLINRVAGSEQQLELVAKINNTRLSQGLKALAINQSLMSAAQDYAQTLSNIGDIDHIGPTGDKPGDRARDSGYNWGFIAENLASGQDSPELTVSDWLKSPSHRDALLHVDPIHIGVGHVSNPNDPNYKEYWVMLVGTPLG